MPGIEFGRGENEDEFRICNAHMPWVPIGSEWAIYKLYVFFVFIYLFLTIKWCYKHPSRYMYGVGENSVYLMD